MGRQPKFRKGTKRTTHISQVRFEKLAMVSGIDLGCWLSFGRTFSSILVSSRMV